MAGISQNENNGKEEVHLQRTGCSVQGFLCGKSNDLLLIVCVCESLAVMPTKAQDSVSVQSKTHRIMYSANPCYQDLRHVNGLLSGWASGGPFLRTDGGALKHRAARTEPQVATAWQVIKHPPP